MEKFQQEELIKTLQKHSSSYAWEFTDMKGINPETCIHHIYIEENSRPIRKTKIRMNPNLREIMKDELQKISKCKLHLPNFR